MVILYNHILNNIIEITRHIIVVVNFVLDALFACSLSNVPIATKRKIATDFKSLEPIFIPIFLLFYNIYKL